MKQYTKHYYNIMLATGCIFRKFISRTYLEQLVANVKNMKCTGLKAVSYPDTRMIIKAVPYNLALTPVYFIFSVRVRLFLLYETINLFRLHGYI